MRSLAARAAVAGLVLAVVAPICGASEEFPAARSARAPILIAMGRVVDRLATKFRSRSGDEPRISVASGILGLGAYTPRGGSDWGMAARPLQVLPRAGLGASLNVDPVSGKPF